MPEVEEVVHLMSVLVVTLYSTEWWWPQAEVALPGMRMVESIIMGEMEAVTWEQTGIIKRFQHRTMREWVLRKLRGEAERQSVALHVQEMEHWESGGMLVVPIVVHLGGQVEVVPDIMAVEEASGEVEAEEVTIRQQRPVVPASKGLIMVTGR